LFFNIEVVNKLLDIYFKNCSQKELAKCSILFAVGTSIFLVILKGMAWFATSSISMQASFNDSCLDAFVSFVAYHALKFSSVNYDVNHNFGHEKVEGVVAIFQCLLIMYSGFIICRESYAFFLNPKPISNTAIGLAVMIVSCIAIYQLIYFQKYVIAKTESIIVTGDSLHYLSDFFMNICILMSLVLSKYFIYVDVICGLIVGAYVFYNAFIIMKNALKDLMDKALPEKTQKKIENAILSIDGVKNIKILRTRSAGMKKYVESRIIVDENISIHSANKITEKAEDEIKKIFENVDVIIKAESA